MERGKDELRGIHLRNVREEERTPRRDSNGGGCCGCRHRANDSQETSGGDGCYCEYWYQLTLNPKVLEVWIFY